MVEYILGNYLVETGKLTEEQLETVVAKQDETRVKLGLLAVSEGIMTIEQAEKVNQLQSTMDKIFGDIAVEQLCYDALHCTPSFGTKHTREGWEQLQETAIVKEEVTSAFS